MMFSGMGFCFLNHCSNENKSSIRVNIVETCHPVDWKDDEAIVK